MLQSNTFEILHSIFDDEEIKMIQNTVVKDRQHPVKRLLHNNHKYQKNGQVANNTNRALRQVSLAGKN